ncbi:MAG: flagellar filament capping protein FliD, partial [Nitrospinota bacterium]
PALVSDGAPTFSSTHPPPAARTGTNTPTTAILNESTGAVTFNEAQTAQVTADYDFDLEFRESQTAKDAIIRFGSGSNAVTIKKSSNMVTDVIEGVTLDLLKVETTNPVIVTVAQNTLLAKSAGENFATALGEVQSFLKDQTFFDSETNETGPLFGDPNVLTIETQVNNILARPVSSIEIGKIRTIAEVGFSISADTGSFQLNSGDLATALSEKPDEVRDFFASVGKATDTDIEVLSFTEATKTSTALGYDVRITQAASRAEIVGAQDVSGGLTTNETLTITVDNNTASIGLTSGLSAQTVVSTINSGLEGVGIKNVRATLDSATGKITLRHDDFGSDKSFKVKSSKAGSTVGSTGLGGSSDNEQRTFTGTDVNGTINGESATGAGQVLTGSTGNLNAAGLKLRVTLTPASLASQGAFQGRVVVSRGIGSQLEEFLAFLTDENKDGPIQSAIDAADDRIEDLQDTIDTVTERSERERARLQREFTQLEQALGTLQTTSQFLDQQLQVIAQNTRFVASRGR